MSYEKHWKSYQEQLKQLTERGLIVTDTEIALHYLERIGYYRLSGYLYPFRKRSGLVCPLFYANGERVKKGKPTRLVLDSFKQGACFKNAIELYIFDKKLRLLVLDALERVEIGLRVDISHRLGKKDTFAYLKPEHLFEDFVTKIDKKTGSTLYCQWLTKHTGLVNRSKEDFIKHYKTKYGLPIPIWVVCEIWNFGTLSTLFAGMKEIDQDKIAQKYGLSNGRKFASWLRSLNYLRNVCAHHSRLWNRNIIDRPKLPSAGEVSWVEPFIGNNHCQTRVFLLLCISKHLLTTINPNTTWWERLNLLLSEFPDLSHLEIDLKSMGIVENMEQWTWNPTK